MTKTITCDDVQKLIGNSELKRKFSFLADPPKISVSSCCGSKEKINCDEVMRKIAEEDEENRKLILKSLGVTVAVLNYKRHDGIEETKVIFVT